MLVISVGLGALVWSCESQQTGYEVAIPLIGPLEFDETSCEISGDICTSDEECVDEDGLFVGPCTKTLTPLESITVDVSLSPSNPSYTLPAPETGRWLSPLAVLQNTDTNPIVLTTEGFSITGGPVTLLVEPFSRIGLISGRNITCELAPTKPDCYDPVGPASCTFTLDDSSTGQDYSDGISTCLRDWVKENGAPLQFDIRVTSSAGTSAKSEFGLKQDADYKVDGTDTWSTAESCDGQDSDQALDAIGEGSDFFGLLNCDTVEATGSVWSSEQVEVWGTAEVYDQCGNHLATGSLGSTVDRVLIGPNDESSPYEIKVFSADGYEPEPDVVPVVFEPGAEDFFRSLFSAGAGECESGEPLPELGGTGYAAVDWNHCLPEGVDPVPRTGGISFGAKGFCPVAEESGGAGATDGSGE